VVDKVDPGQARIADLIDKDIPQEAYELLAIYLREASILGKRTAELHIALSQDTDDASIRPEPMSKDDLKVLKEEMHADIDLILAQLKAKRASLAPDMVEASDELLRFRSNMLEVIDSIDSVKAPLLKMRCHGDYHLGQVLYRAGDFVILDFEGEPAKSMAHRQRKHSPMKDIAGMVRSFSYAAWAGLFLFLHNRPEDLERYMPWAKICQTWVSVSFLKGYLETAAGHDFIPSTRADFFRVLLPFIMDKAMYEIKYELNNRPDWLKVPVSGILQYLRANTLNSEAASPK
jgi:maltose alpha-D-glucosyltransferase / alpha-amylase